ncbi:hypothetical protein ACIBO5_23925 [Nonomuraea angiospora]|uniref:hypothetical protein n=1 Tax=Nonomuraea angiospora TaxID=46172 RepID=UPI0037946FD9
MNTVYPDLQAGPMDLTAAQKQGRHVVPLRNTPRVQPHKDFVVLAMATLEEHGFPHGCADPGDWRQLVDALSNPASQTFPLLGPFAELTARLRIGEARYRQLAGLWQEAADVYVRRGQFYFSAPLPQPFRAGQIQANGAGARLPQPPAASTQVNAAPARQPQRPPSSTQRGRRIAAAQVPAAEVAGAQVTVADAGSMVPSFAVMDDMEGFEDLKPNPLAATTVLEFLEAMRLFRIWSGEEPLAELARRSRGTFATSTLCETLSEANTKRLPTLRVVKAFIKACGGNDNDVQAWTTAWRAVRLGAARGASSRPVRHLKAADAS